MPEMQLSSHISFDAYTTSFYFYSTFKCNNILQHVQKYLSLSCIEVFSWFKWVKKSVKNNLFAIHLLSLNRSESSCLCSFKKAPTSCRRSATLSNIFLRDNHQMFAWYRSPRCSFPFRHKTLEINKCLRDGFLYSLQQILPSWALKPGFLEYFLLLGFLYADDYENIVVLFFSQSS